MKCAKLHEFYIFIPDKLALQMSITPESAKALLTDENFGKRIQGINELREIGAADAFELLPLVWQRGRVCRFWKDWKV